MKYLKQFCILLFFSFAGEMIHHVVPLPVPAAIYGLLLLFIALCTRILHRDSVREICDFFIVIMPVMFVAPAVNLVDYWGGITPNLGQITLLIVTTTLGTFAVSGTVTQVIIRYRERRKNRNERDIARK
ncbi:MAG: lrgA [Herbinix sp.]|jgi:holin-like protein|nr:lrgA [Herbinix sp.]